MDDLIQKLDETIAVVQRYLDGARTSETYEAKMQKLEEDLIEFRNAVVEGKPVEVLDKLGGDAMRDIAEIVNDPIRHTSRRTLAEHNTLEIDVVERLYKDQARNQYMELKESGEYKDYQKDVKKGRVDPVQLLEVPHRESTVASAPSVNASSPAVANMKERVAQLDEIIDALEQHRANVGNVSAQFDVLEDRLVEFRNAAAEGKMSGASVSQENQLQHIADRLIPIMGAAEEKALMQNEVGAKLDQALDGFSADLKEYRAETRGKDTSNVIPPREEGERNPIETEPLAVRRTAAQKPDITPEEWQESVRKVGQLIQSNGEEALRESYPAFAEAAKLDKNTDQLTAQELAAYVIASEMAADMSRGKEWDKQIDSGDFNQAASEGSGQGFGASARVEKLAQRIYDDNSNVAVVVNQDVAPEKDKQPDVQPVAQDASYDALVEKQNARNESAAKTGLQNLAFINGNYDIPQKTWEDALDVAERFIEVNGGVGALKDTGRFSDAAKLDGDAKLSVEEVATQLVADEMARRTDVGEGPSGGKVAVSEWDGKIGADDAAYSVSTKDIDGLSSEAKDLAKAIGKEIFADNVKYSGTREEADKQFVENAHEIDNDRGR